jgi:hypothetical protein
MQDIKLPDGTWVTTPMAVGIGKPPVQCSDETCVWKDFGPPTTPEIDEAIDTGTPVQLQKCPRCGYVRGRYLGNPHPEFKDDDDADHGRGDADPADDDDHGPSTRPGEPPGYMLI